MLKLRNLGFIVIVALLLAALSQPAFAEVQKVNINTATVKELVTLKHIGKKTAEKIIEYRKDHPFTKPEDLMKVKGIGEKTFQDIKDMIVVK